MSGGVAPLATVVVVTYRGAQWLPRCLDRLAELRGEGPPFSVWVVDNASTDGTAELLAARADVRVIRSETNLGFAGGNNLALRAVTTPFAVLLNDDALPEPGWLGALLAPFEGPGGERVAAVVPRLLLLGKFARLGLRLAGASRIGVQEVRRDGEEVTDAVVWEPLLVPGTAPGPTRWCRPQVDLPVPLGEPSGPVLDRETAVSLRVVAPSPAQLELSGGGRVVRAAVGTEPATITLDLPAGTATADLINSTGTRLSADGYAGDRGYGEAADARADPRGEVFGGCGAALALRTAALREVGVFDDDYFLYYEDVDLSWRLRRAGWTVRYEPSSTVRHQHSASTGRSSELHLFHDHRNRLLTLTRNASAPVALRTVGRYPLTTLSLAVRARRGEEVPVGLGSPALRRRVLASYLRLLPRTLRARIRQTSRVSRTAVERWLS
jgi:GT2 family glycosyltransferase